MSTISLLLCTLLAWPAIQQDYETIFAEDYQQALRHARETAPLLDWMCQRHDLPSAEVAAIAFPELIRYSAFKDFFETQAVSKLYVQSGAEYANFSIGKLQMRPTFLAELEEVAAAYPSIQSRYDWVLLFPAQLSEKEQRAQRLERLSSNLGQLKILCAFYELALKRYPLLADYSPAKRVRYLAVLYNHGFVDKLEALKPWLNKRSFPYGWRHDPTNQHPYSALSQYFYERQAKIFFPD